MIDRVCKVSGEWQMRKDFGTKLDLTKVWSTSRDWPKCSLQVGIDQSVVYNFIWPKCGQQVGFDQKCGLQFLFYQSVAHKLDGTLILEEIADGMNEFQEACRSAASL